MPCNHPAHSLRGGASRTAGQGEDDGGTLPAAPGGLGNGAVLFLQWLSLFLQRQSLVLLPIPQWPLGRSAARPLPKGGQVQGEGREISS